MILPSPTVTVRRPSPRHYTASAPAFPSRIKNFTAPAVWSFRNDVQPVLTKMGCNSGPCHGAAAGKNGFKLTLRGYDAEADYLTLTHQALARRTERMEPAKSLILLKPTLTIPHGGGKRFAVDSPEYQVVSGWIAQGMPAPEGVGRAGDEESKYSRRKRRCVPGPNSNWS